VPPILVNGLQVHNRVQTCGTVAWSSMPTPLQGGENNGLDERPLKGHFGPSRLRHQGTPRIGHPWPLFCRQVIFSMAPRGIMRFASYTFTSPFSLNSAAENGLFFFWFR